MAPLSFWASFRLGFLGVARLVSSEYVLAVPQEANCPVGYEKVTSEAECCSITLEVEGLTIPQYSDNSYCNVDDEYTGGDEYPHGCQRYVSRSTDYICAPRDYCIPMCAITHQPNLAAHSRV